LKKNNLISLIQDNKNELILLKQMDDANIDISLLTLAVEKIISDN
jgi:hypothetical protein